MPARTAADALRALPARDDSREMKARIKRLEALVERQAETIERARASRVALPKGGPKRAKRGGFVRVIVPDSHGAHIDPDACRAFLADLESRRPR